MYIVNRKTEDETIKLAECGSIEEAIDVVEVAMKAIGNGCVYEIRRVEEEANG